MKTSLLLALTFFPFFHLCAQNGYEMGYIITLDGDTVPGSILNDKPMQMAILCDFVAGTDSERRIYLPGQIMGFRFADSKYYVSKIVVQNGKKVPLFLDFLVDGEANLFYYRSKDNLHYYIEGRDGKLIELLNTERDIVIGDQSYVQERKEYLQILSMVFGDAPQLQSKVKNLSMAHQKLINITKEYHDLVCTDGGQCILYEKDVEVDQFIGLQLIGGLPFIDVNVKRGYSRSRFVGVSPGISQSALVKYAFAGLFGMNPKMSVHTGLGVTNTSYRGENMSFRQTGVIFPMILRYQLSNPKERVFIQGGVSNIFNFSNKETVLYTQQEDYFQSDLGFYQIQGSLGIGMELESGSGRCSVSLNYMTKSPITGLDNVQNNYLSSSIHGAELQVGYYFKR